MSTLEFIPKTFFYCLVTIIINYKFSKKIVTTVIRANYDYISKNVDLTISPN